jgi:hypothetical protein
MQDLQVALGAEARQGDAAYHPACVVVGHPQANLQMPCQQQQQTLLHCVNGNQP